MPRGVPNTTVEIRDPEQEKREILFLQALRDTLPSLRLYSDDKLRKKIGPEKVEDLTLEFFGFMEAGAGPLNQNEQLALACQMLKSLSKYVANQLKLAVTVKTLTDSMSLLEAAVDVDWPGYFISKLLKYSVSSVRTVA